VKSVLVDLDGVLATYDGWRGIGHVGEPRPGAAEFLRRLKDVARVVIYTTRCKAYSEGTPGPEGMPEPDRSAPEALAARVRAWLDAHGLEYDEVYTGQGKPFAAAIVDDRAVAVPTNPAGLDFERALLGVYHLLERKP
jgi:hypothetical protein